MVTQVFLIGVGCGICIGVGCMLHWHVGRVRELWRQWTEGVGK